MIAATNTQITDARAAFQKLSFRGSHSEFVAATTLITGLLDGLRAPGGPAVDLQAECVRIREGMQILNEYHERFGMNSRLRGQPAREAGQHCRELGTRPPKCRS